MSSRCASMNWISCACSSSRFFLIRSHRMCGVGILWLSTYDLNTRNTNGCLVATAAARRGVASNCCRPSSSSGVSSSSLSTAPDTIACCISISSSSSRCCSCVYSSSDAAAWSFSRRYMPRISTVDSRYTSPNRSSTSSLHSRLSSTSCLLSSASSFSTSRVPILLTMREHAPITITRK